jgi:hypothetical protein
MTATVNEWCSHTGMSRNTAFRQMVAGTLRFVQDAPNALRRIPFSEYARHGLDTPTEADFIVIKPKVDARQADSENQMPMPTE